MTNYEKYLASLKLRHFQPHEITRYGKAVRGRVRNSLPPDELWKNIAPTLRVLDRCREIIGKPIVLTSVYRSPAYNTAVGGARYSQHLRNNATDFQVHGAFDEEAWTVLHQLRAAGEFRGGLGRYATFIHLDTRGTNADW